jgi:hypothetical protein
MLQVLLFTSWRKQTFAFLLNKNFRKADLLFGSLYDELLKSCRAFQKLFAASYKPVATVLLPRSFTRVSRTFSSRYRAIGFNTPPACKRACATSGRTSVR